MRIVVQDANIIIDRAPLLTGDRKLRKTSESRNLEVRGILWVFDQMVDRSVLSLAEAQAKLLELQTINPRLPKNQIEKRLRAWGR